ncbi:expressed unknown protein [Ectocarpus siliculosus]|uniref:Uncharacterized protein n=1 Tax=Ectocarpus siliculosus TaxID=2880 RepID=D8LHT3_ECTSI|nr:expressed unknown protein [Ectocarpus siliculosus]|eukprot:CBN74364.1 expressed unknown protein [Ectocarpus siliculosus]
MLLAALLSSECGEIMAGSLSHHWVWAGRRLVWSAFPLADLLGSDK